jgi:hypothetical protein
MTSRDVYLSSDVFNVFFNSLGRAQRYRKVKRLKLNEF